MFSSWFRFFFLRGFFFLVGFLELLVKVRNEMKEGKRKKERKKGRKEEREALRGFQEGDGKERVEISQKF